MRYWYADCEILHFVFLCNGYELLRFARQSEAVWQKKRCVGG